MFKNTFIFITGNASLNGDARIPKFSVSNVYAFNIEAIL